MALFLLLEARKLAFATLQLDLAKANKEQTLTGIKEIESGQTKKKEITEA